MAFARYILGLRSPTQKPIRRKGLVMKYKKFLDLNNQYPSLARDLSWRGVLRNLKEFVKKKVGFIAYRPFEKLDLTAKEESIASPLKCYKLTQYELHFHVEGEGEGTRLRHVSPGIGDGSIQAHIDEITKWFDGCETFRGKQLIWERAIKRTVSGSSHAGVTEMNLEIYLFPPRYRFKRMSLAPTPPPDPAMIAWITGGEMPPIIPRMV